MTRPWFQFYSRDWLDNKELRRCRPDSRALLVDLMCIAHEGDPYGYLADSVGALTAEYLSARVHMNLRAFNSCLSELVQCTRIKQDERGFFISRMVKDEELRMKRADGGRKSIGHPNTHPPKEGYPSIHPFLSREGYPSTHPSLSSQGSSDLARGRVGAFDSDSSSEVLKTTNPERKDLSHEEFEEAWERHSKHIRSETRQLVLQRILGMNGEFDIEKFRSRHRSYCSSWEGEWKFCPLSFLGWIEAGMPLPPKEKKFAEPPPVSVYVDPFKGMK